MKAFFRLGQLFIPLDIYSIVYILKVKVLPIKCQGLDTIPNEKDAMFSFLAKIRIYMLTKTEFQIVMVLSVFKMYLVAKASRNPDRINESKSLETQNRTVKSCENSYAGTYSSYY